MIQIICMTDTSPVYTGASKDGRVYGMQVYDAEFFPVREGNVKRNYFKIAGIAFCLLLIALLLFRIYGWSRERQNTRFLSLVNQWNDIESSDFKPRLKKAEGSIELDRRCLRDFKRMMADCRSSGAEPVLISGYRDRKTQEELYASENRRPDAGKIPAGEILIAAPPGRSEHELGLAADIMDAECINNPDPSKPGRSSEWLMENCWSYGFILRYPRDKEDITGIAFSPFHYRYVGKTAALQMKELNICLEEYIEMFYSPQAVLKFED